MASIFSQIIAGQIPGTFVWADEVCVAMATICPSRPGHVMVIPRAEVAKFTDVHPDTFAHVMKVAQIIGHAQEQAFGVPRSILAILGFEVPHTHIHVVPADSEEAANFHDIPQASGAEIDAAMEKLRAALSDLGHSDHIPELHRLPEMS
ncbi:HIT family protein [Trueperella sp. LYQ143]|uniref:HIT family protein n=1 Tax=unclassified Trueperella TaxID=2630174 RepID=UPI003983B23A